MTTTRSRISPTFVRVVSPASTAASTSSSSPSPNRSSLSTTSSNSSPITSTTTSPTRRKRSGSPTNQHHQRSFMTSSSSSSRSTRLFPRTTFLRNCRFVLLCHLPLLLVFQWYVVRRNNNNNSGTSPSSSSYYHDTPIATNPFHFIDTATTGSSTTSNNNNPTSSTTSNFLSSPASSTSNNDKSDKTHRLDFDAVKTVNGEGEDQNKDRFVRSPSSSSVRDGNSGFLDESRNKQRQQQPASAAGAGVQAGRRNSTSTSTNNPTTNRTTTNNNATSSLSQQQQQQQQRHPVIPLLLSSPTTNMMDQPPPANHNTADTADTDTDFPPLVAPVSVIIIGTKETMIMGEILSPTTLQKKSKYIHVVQTVTYSPTTRRSHIENYDDETKNSQNPPIVVVYIVDWAALSRDCHVLQRILLSPSSSLSNNNINNNNNDATNISMLLLPSVPSDNNNNGTSYLLYLDTSSSSRTVLCPSITSNQHQHRRFEQIRYAKQNMIENRYWNHTKQWVVMGSSIIQNINNNYQQGEQERKMMKQQQQLDGPLLHAPQILRESFVHQLYNVTNNAIIGGVKNNNNLTLTEVVPYVKRKTDVAHFWRKGGNLHYSFLRRRVSADIVALGEERNNNNNNNKDSLRYLVRVLGDEKMIEQNRVSEEYVKQMLSTKVVVVVQHDEWEDGHYRLFEAMASGAMVMSDSMVLPPVGLEDNVNIVFYNSSTSLKQQLLHYLLPENEKQRLEIARRGMEFALGRQRGWHRIEELLFGKPLTKVK